MIYSVFLKHPITHGYTYVEHLSRAWLLGWTLLKGSVALFIHGAIPSVYEDVGSMMIKEAHSAITASQMRYESVTHTC